MIEVLNWCAEHPILAVVLSMVWVGGVTNAFRVIAVAVWRR